jgi:hypothetical protein
MENKNLENRKDENDKAVLKNLNERFSKWQMKQIDYLTFNINLILTLSIAILVYLLNTKNTANLKSEITISILYFRIYTILLTSIVTIGVIINILRYFDFKYTKDTIKIKKKLVSEKSLTEIQKLNAKLNSNKCKTKILGILTKSLFLVMTIVFLFTIWTIILNI